MTVARVVICVAITVALTACGNGNVRTTAERTTTTAAATQPRTPLDRGVAALIGDLDRIDRASLMVFDYVAQTYDLKELSRAIEAEAGRRAGQAPTVDERLLARLEDQSAPPPEPDGGTEHVTSDLLALALHCDQRPTPAGYATQLRSVAADGGYGTTHALLATVWMEELGCPPPEASLRRELEDRVGSALASASVVNDLELERSAFLLHAGRADLIPPDWASRVEAAQLTDGGWGQKGPDSERSWHATGLAVWTLAGLASPGSRIPMLRAAR